MKALEETAKLLDCRNYKSVLMFFRQCSDERTAPAVHGRLPGVLKLLAALLSVCRFPLSFGRICEGKVEVTLDPLFGELLTVRPSISS